MYWVGLQCAIGAFLGYTYLFVGQMMNYIDLDQINYFIKVSKGAKIRNRYSQVPHLTQDTNGKVTDSQFDTTNESQDVIPFPAGDHKAHINRRSQRHSKHKTEKTQKKYRLGMVSGTFYWRV